MGPKIKITLKLLYTTMCARDGHLVILKVTVPVYRWDSVGTSKRCTGMTAKDNIPGIQVEKRVVEPLLILYFKE